MFTSDEITHFLGKIILQWNLYLYPSKSVNFDLNYRKYSGISSISDETTEFLGIPVT